MPGARPLGNALVASLALVLQRHKPPVAAIWPRRTNNAHKRRWGETMDARKSQATHLGQPLAKTERQERYLEEHNRCAMCDSELEIGHEVDSAGVMLKEEAHCPLCGVQVRAVRHRLH
jgi:hypothetical protein